MELNHAGQNITLTYFNELPTSRQIRIRLITEKAEGHRFGYSPIQRICRILEMTNPGRKPWEKKVVRDRWRPRTISSDRSTPIIPIYIFWSQHPEKSRIRILQQIRKTPNPKIVFLLNLDELVSGDISSENPHLAWGLPGNVIFFSFNSKFQPIQQAVFESILYNWDLQTNVFQKMVNLKNIPIYRQLQDCSLSLQIEDLDLAEN